jgi:hypothetical protein
MNSEEASSTAPVVVVPVATSRRRGRHREMPTLAHLPAPEARERIQEMARNRYQIFRALREQHAAELTPLQTELADLRQRHAPPNCRIEAQAQELAQLRSELTGAFVANESLQTENATLRAAEAAHAQELRTLQLEHKLRLGQARAELTRALEEHFVVANS